MFKIITALCILLLFISNSEAEVSKEKKKVKATWYQCCNKHTASGDVFNPINCNIAHRFLPFGTNVRLTNPDNGSFVDTTVNDRGPYVKGIDIDVTKGCAIELGFFRSGKTKLIFEIINDNK